jgi:bifunctional non-homologous end joining protein LigD
MLASTGTALPRDQAAWAFEVKWDGMRVLAYLPGDGRLRLVSRRGTDVTARYPELADLPRLLPGTGAVLDGEIVAFDERGRPSFARLQERMPLESPAAIRAGARTTPVALMLFDVLWVGGEPLTGLPYTARRLRLAALELEAERVSVPPAWEGEGETAARWTAEMGLEGVMAKRLASPYRPGARSRDWVKIKHGLTADVRVGGWVPAGPRGAGLKSVLVGVDEPGGLRYCGAVGSGFTVEGRRVLAETLRGLAAPGPPFTNARQARDRPGPLRWARPVLAAEVAFTGWTAQGLLRQPVWRGLRED